jgi:hypothetical protein
MSCLGCLINISVNRDLNKNPSYLRNIGTISFILSHTKLLQYVETIEQQPAQVEKAPS